MNDHEPDWPEKFGLFLGCAALVAWAVISLIYIETLT